MDSLERKCTGKINWINRRSADDQNNLSGIRYFAAPIALFLFIILFYFSLFILQKFIDVRYGMDYGSLTLQQLKAELWRRNARLLESISSLSQLLSSAFLVHNLLMGVYDGNLDSDIEGHSTMALRQSKQNAKRRCCSTVKVCSTPAYINDVCFGKTADVRQMAIRLLSSRLMCKTVARHKITFSFIVQLTYMMCNSEWYGHVPYECHFSMKIYFRPSLYLFLKILVNSLARMPDFSRNLTFIN